MSDMQAGSLCPTDRRIGWVGVGEVRHWVQRAELRRVRDEKRQAWLLQKFRTQTTQAEQRTTKRRFQADRSDTLTNDPFATVVDAFRLERPGKPLPADAQLRAVADAVYACLAEQALREEVESLRSWQVAAEAASAAVKEAISTLKTLVQMHDADVLLQLSSPGLQVLHGDWQGMHAAGLVRHFVDAENLIQDMEVFTQNYLLPKVKRGPGAPVTAVYMSDAAVIAPLIADALKTCGEQRASITRENSPALRITSRLLALVCAEPPAAGTLAERFSGKAEKKRKRRNKGHAPPATLAADGEDGPDGSRRT